MLLLRTGSAHIDVRQPGGGGLELLNPLALAQKSAAGRGAAALTAASAAEAIFGAADNALRAAARAVGETVAPTAARITIACADAAPAAWLPDSLGAGAAPTSGAGAADATPCVLDGHDAVRIATIPNSGGVPLTVTFRGITFLAGRSARTESYDGGFGGAIAMGGLVVAGDRLVTDFCVFRGNAASFGGGAVAVRGSGKPEEGDARVVFAASYTLFDGNAVSETAAAGGDGGGAVTVAEFAAFEAAHVRFTVREAAGRFR